MAEQTATLKSRVDIITLPVLVGMTVSEARDRFRTVLNIPAGATPSVDNAPVAENYRIQAGDTVVFNVALGEKGC